VEVAAEQPDVIIADSNMPDAPIIALVQDLRSASPASRIVLRSDITEGTFLPSVEVVRRNLRVLSATAVDRYAILDRQRGLGVGESATAGQERARS